ncbi:5-methyltetrahydropteroyltriglutamate--homocysteine methyltransferase [Allocatelliglobosispora scoriae]|uniref:5-methyltetrahydropteroyltriglutamate--homocysteine S-methyltransferase n=1 Tax=Allocatelliglobosispora scoriae TaxID=643052 RepID=A0A841BXP7_9ACTN|nr:5-methyltetrahydropteroyltriglutamate--homocysteine S-methyltransferase [Allocatelliglobosispora scoriae]MBB5872934.1 5-methyltetrahydropteroyltriglutamate--homocysteine methyltransferase [Allocatelliglobosispora scoriae]
MQTPFPPSTVLGYPRIGPHRELKKALESHWDGTIGADELAKTARELREQTWLRLRDLGLGAVPSNTFSYYDQVLDTAVLLGAVPARYRALPPGDAYFAMARGTQGVAPLRMTKWFDTNYHYIVPEIDATSPFRLDAAKVLDEVREARELGIETRPVIVGPVTFLSLAQAAPGGPAGFAPLDRLGDVVAVYAELLAALHAEGVSWVQLDEPILVTDLDAAVLAGVRAAYTRLGDRTARPRLLVAAPFGELGEALPVLASTAIDAVGLDLVRGRVPADLGLLAGKTVVAGVVSGRDIWRTHLGSAAATLRAVRAQIEHVVVATSCSLQHVPYDLALEDGLDDELRERLAFAEQKVAEIVSLADAPARAPQGAPETSAPARGVTERSEGAPQGAPVTADSAGGKAVPTARSPYAVRAAAQAAHLRLPALPVTTIGSFPQTPELRAARTGLVGGSLPAADYDRRVRAEIERAIRLQERLGVDVLVHGEPERNDMVQFFAERLDGFAVTKHGWVQSYGSRCTRPPILHGEVKRPAPMTVELAAYAQSLTDKPVKGMLTGPVTITAWSFVRRDVPLGDLLDQVGAAIRDEVADLEAAGIGIIQVDEPALRELLPLRRAEQAEYLAWAVGAYRVATSGAADRTQIHTHLCYSNAAEVLDAIDALDADVTTIESARSHGTILGVSGLPDFARGLGPGVYDIHSPRVPGVEEVEKLIAAALAVLPADRVWVNPDCGLKTRTYPQVEAALTHVVRAAARQRLRLAAA